MQVRPREMKSVGKLDEADKLQMDEGDMIIVIDGRLVVYYYLNVPGIRKL